MAVRPTALRLIAASKPNHHFVKTHCQPIRILGRDVIPADVTAAAIYILRNPFDLAPSFARHQSCDLDTAITRMMDPDMSTGSATGIFETLGRWDDHVKTWTTAPGLPRHVIRYEDLLQDAGGVMTGLLETFLRVKVDKPKLDYAIGETSFDALKKQESEKGFTERPPHMQAFFARGQAGVWREDLTPAQVGRCARASCRCWRNGTPKCSPRRRSSPRAAEPPGWHFAAQRLFPAEHDRSTLMIRHAVFIALATALAGCAAATGPRIVAQLGSDPVLSGGSYSTGGGLTVAADIREYQGRTLVCGVWAQSDQQSILTKGKARGVVATGSVSVAGQTVVRGLGFMNEVPPMADYAGQEAGCTLTDRAWQAGDATRRPRSASPGRSSMSRRTSRAAFR